MVDCVKLILFDQAKEMWKLECRDSLWLEEDRKSADEIENIGDMRQNVIGRHEISRMSGAKQRPGSFLSKKHHFCRHAFGDGRFCYIARRFDTENWNVTRHEILQEITVIARHFDHFVLRPEPEEFFHRDDIGFDMLQPAR